MAVWNMSDQTKMRFEAERSKDETQEELAKRVIDVFDISVERANLLDRQLRDNHKETK